MYLKGKIPLCEIAVIGDELMRGPIRGVALNFHGLGCTQKKVFWQEEQDWAALGWLVVFPFYGPWSWMNRNARVLVDDIVNAVYEQFYLPDTCPLAAVGGSMGGMAALIYSRYAQRKIDRCYAQYPVCDLRKHLHEREDIPKTIHNAALGYEGGLDEFFRETSPMEQAEALPDIPYLILTGDADTVVSKELHSDVFAAEMRTLGKNLQYIVVPDYGHGDGDVAQEYYKQTLNFMSLE